MKPSKKTTITPIRFTTSILNWLAKPVYLFSFLFLLVGCEEDLTTLGFKSQQSKVKVYYAEIPLASSLLLMDSLRTTNLIQETNRLLSGSYMDPVFGLTQAQAITQYRPYSVSTPIPADAVFDSIVLRLKFDFYAYGSLGTTTQSFDVHEINTELNLDDDYFFNTAVDISNPSIGSASYDVNYDFFKEQYDDTATDSLITLNIKLDNSFGQRLFDAVDPEDVNYTNFEIFKTVFKGLAVVPNQADKIIGFNPNPPDLSSLLNIYYHNGTDTLTYSFVLTQCVTFSKIISDRSTTELSGLNQYFTDFDPGNKRYIQSGSSIITKLDFTKFYDYIDTLSNIIVNSAELEVSGIESSTQFPAPQSLAVGMLRANNRFTTLANEQDSLNFIAFNGMLTTADQLKFFVAQSPGSIFYADQSTTDNTYSGLPTLFVQKLIDLKSTRYPYWALRPLVPQPGKSVDRAIFPKDNIKLKIYYTRASLENQ